MLGKGQPRLRVTATEVHNVERVPYDVMVDWHLPNLLS